MVLTALEVYSQLSQELNLAITPSGLSDDESEEVEEAAGKTSEANPCTHY